MKKHLDGIPKSKPTSYNKKGWGNIRNSFLVGCIVTLLLGHTIYSAFAQLGPNYEDFDQYVNPAIDITHVPPLISQPGEIIQLEFLLSCNYLVNTDLPCNPEVNLYITYGSDAKFHLAPMKKELRDSMEMLVAEVPASNATGQALQYYLEISDPNSVFTNRYPLIGTIEVTVVPKLREVFLPSTSSNTSGTLILSIPWGDGPEEVGLGKEVPAPTGPDAFDIAPDGDIALLDEVNKRVLLFDSEVGDVSSIPVGLKGWGDVSFTDTGEIAVLDLVGGKTSDSGFKVTRQLYVLEPGSRNIRAVEPIYLHGLVNLISETRLVDINLGRIFNPFDSVESTKKPEDQLINYSQAQLLHRWQDDYHSRFADTQERKGVEISGVDPIGAIGLFSRFEKGYVVIFEGDCLRFVWLDSNGEIINDKSVVNEALNPINAQGRFVVNDGGDVFYLSTTPVGAEIRMITAE